MAFKGGKPVRSKTAINNNTMEQINTFNYLSCSVFIPDLKRHHCQNNRISPDNGNYWQNFKPLSSPNTHQTENLLTYL
jgi:hypothetical protein